MAKNTSYTTKHRQMIDEYLKNNKDKTIHVSDIYEYLIKNEIKINLTTVYRYIDKLAAEKKLIKYASDKGDKASYQYVEESPSCNDHLHMQCMKCGKLIHLDCEFMKEFNAHIKAHHDFNIEYNKSILYGLCTECANKDK